MADLPREIIEAMVRAQYDPKIHRANPNGCYPTCKNALWTTTCERCGRDIRGTKGPCPLVPPEGRWGPDA